MYMAGHDRVLDDIPDLPFTAGLNSLLEHFSHAGHDKIAYVVRAIEPLFHCPKDVSAVFKQLTAFQAVKFVAQAANFFDDFGGYGSRPANRNEVSSSIDFPMGQSPANEFHRIRWIHRRFAGCQ